MGFATRPDMNTSAGFGLLCQGGYDPRVLVNAGPLTAIGRPVATGDWLGHGGGEPEAGGDCEAVGGDCEAVGGEQAAGGGQHPDEIFPVVAT